MKINVKNLFSKQNLKKIFIEYLAIIALVVIDIAFKVILEKYFVKGGSDITILPNFLSLTYAKNTGAAFSLFADSTLSLTISSVVFLIILMAFDIFTENKNKWHLTSFALIIAGGIGNFIDRVSLGFVRDFIRFDFINFPIFNVADMFLTFGIAIYIYYVFFVYAKYEKD